MSQPNYYPQDNSNIPPRPSWEPSVGATPPPPSYDTQNSASSQEAYYSPTHQQSTYANETSYGGVGYAQGANVATQGQTSLILGIVSIVGLFIFPLVSIICGGIGVKMAAKDENNAGKVMSMIGLVCGIVFTLIFVALFLFALFVPLLIGGAPTPA